MVKEWDEYATRLQAALADDVSADVLPGLLTDLRDIHLEYRHQCAGWSEGLACCLDALTGCTGETPVTDRTPVTDGA